MFSEILQNSQENTCTRVSFLIKLEVPDTPSTPSKPFYEARQAHYFMTYAKHPILWSTPSTSNASFCEAGQAGQFFEAQQACHFIKHTKNVSRPSTQTRKTRQTREHVKYTSTPSTQTRKAREHASTSFSRFPNILTFLTLSVALNDQSFSF